MGNIRQKVALQGVRFFAYHGYYPEEQVLGTEFILDIETEMDIFSSQEKEDINQTINYERLYAIAAAEMKRPRKLLETVAYAILDQIREEYLLAKNIRVAIKKSIPLMGGEINNSLVELTFSR